MAPATECRVEDGPEDFHPRRGAPPWPPDMLRRAPLVRPRRGKQLASESIYLESGGRKRAGQRPLNGLALNVGSAYESLRGNWFRAGLTILGVVIGVAAVIVLVAFGQGARQEITGQIDTLGMNVAIVVPGKMQGQANFNPTGGMGISNLSDRDVEAIRRMPGIRAAAPITFITGAVFRGEKPASICMPIATVPEFREIRRLDMDAGRFFTADEMEQAVCVLGTGVKKDLFGAEEALGKKITVNDQPYQVIGIVRDRSIGSGLFGGDELNAII